MTQEDAHNSPSSRDIGRGESILSKAFPDGFPYPDRHVVIGSRILKNAGFPPGSIPRFPDDRPGPDYPTSAVPRRPIRPTGSQGAQISLKQKINT